MIDLIKEHEITYQNDLQHSYMVAKLQNSETIIDYQVRMIQENPVQQLLPLYKKQMDKDVYIFYDITSKITLNQFLSRRKLNKHEFLSMLKSLINGLKYGKQYLLQGGSFIMDSDYIYIDPATMELSIAYLPIASNQDETEAAKSLLMDLTIYKASFESPAEGDFIYELLNLLKSENFSIKHLDKLISSMATRAEQYKLTNGSGQQLIIQNGNENNKLFGHFDKEELSYEFANKNLLTDTNSLVLMFSQLFFVAVATLLIRFLYLQNKSLDISTIGGIVIIILGLDILVVKKLKLVENLVLKMKDLLPNNKRLNVDTVVKQKNTYIPDRSVKELAVTQESLRQKDPKAFETRFLSEELPKQACLIGYGENKHERIYINKPYFTFGRISAQCDFLSGNRAVGKLHAEIIYKDGAYYIKDLNTRNGTYINGKRIVSNVEHSIHNHDLITFANSEYEFQWS